MVVAMPAMRMMQMPGHEVIHMVAVRHRFVAAVGAVRVPGFMSIAFVAHGAIVRIHPAHANRVFIVVVIMMMVQVPVVQIIDVIFVLYPSVPASRSVDVDMVAIGVHLMRHDV